jgi:hypothetical protein
MSAFTPARQFILDALRLDGGMPQVRMGDEDWAEFMLLARMHRLGPMLHHRLGRCGFSIPQEVREQLLESHRRQTMRNLNLYRELVVLAKLLGEADIPFIALKGAYLARFAYPEAGLRPMRDLDLLLAPDQTVRAFELLVSHGYRSASGGAPEAYFADRIHLPPLRGPGGVSVELHHRLTPAAMWDAAFEEPLLRRSIRLSVASVSVSFLCREDMLLHLCIHASLEHQLDLGPLALMDVALLLEAGQMDWQDFLHRVEGGRWQRCVLPVLFLTKRHLGAKVPENVIAVLGGGNEAAWLDCAEHLLFSAPEDHKLLDYDVQEILYSGKISERISKLVGVLFPPRTVIARHFSVDADSAKAFLYYPLRWYRMARGKLPALLRAHVGRKQSLRQLALSRNAFGEWLRDGGAGGRR